MLHRFLYYASFHKLLSLIDNNLANKVRQGGCPCCGAKLHSSDYPRSPFGLPESLRDLYKDRRSFCCAECRKRTTPPSVRFFGRRWFSAPLFILICALTTGATERRCAAVKRHFGITVSKRTWARWRRWWRDFFLPLYFGNKRQERSQSMHSMDLSLVYYSIYFRVDYKKE